MLKVCYHSSLESWQDTLTLWNALALHEPRSQPPHKLINHSMMTTDAVMLQRLFLIMIAWIQVNKSSFFCGGCTETWSFQQRTFALFETLDALVARKHLGKSHMSDGIPFGTIGKIRQTMTAGTAKHQARWNVLFNHLIDHGENPNAPVVVCFWFHLVWDKSHLRITSSNVSWSCVCVLHAVTTRIHFYCNCCLRSTSKRAHCGLGTRQCDLLCSLFAMHSGGDENNNN